MTKRLLGVAHRTLPCGTQVELAYGGATITVPVVDRGPFKKGRRWDLTAATAEALGFTFTDTIGAVRVG
jgi:rare lipoprotein A (peptidoglycan hydrolase)